MITAVARSILTSCGFGVVLCLGSGGERLASALRALGLAAFGSLNNQDVDTVVADYEPGALHEIGQFNPKFIVLNLPTWVDEELFLREMAAIGFGLHPRCSAFEGLWRRGLRFCAFERSNCLSLTSPLHQQLSQISLFTRIAKLVGAAARVMLIGNDTEVARRVISANSLTNDISSAKECDLPVASPYDQIIITPWTPEDYTAGRIIELEYRLRPGGRLVLTKFSNGREDILSFVEWRKRLSDSLIAESLHVNDEQTQSALGPSWKEYSIKDQMYWAGGWQAVTFMSSPFRAPDAPKQSFYPEYDFDDTGKKYSYPNIVESLVSLQFRIRDTDALSFLLEQARHASVGPIDKAACLCIEAYVLLGKDSGTDRLDLFISRIDHFINEYCNDDPITVRWSISLMYVKGLLLQKYGRLDEAWTSFERCSMSPFLLYAPMLATKCVKASQQLAFLSLSNNDIAAADKWLRHGIQLAAAALGDSLRFYEDVSPPYVLPEMALVASLAAQCNGALIALLSKGATPQVLDSLRCDLASQLESLLIEL